MIKNRLRFLILLFTTIFTPLGVGILIGVQSLSSLMIHPEPKPALIPLGLEPSLVWKSDTVNRVLIILSPQGNEILDIASTYETWGHVPHTEIKTVAPARKWLPTSVQLAVYPDLTLAEASERATAALANIVVIPGLLDEAFEREAPTYLETIRSWVEKADLVLCLGEGARVCAKVHLLDGKTATSHFIALTSLRDSFPKTHWVNGASSVLSHSTLSISSLSANPTGQKPRVWSGAGLMASVDTNLAGIETLRGTAVATSVAHSVGYTKQPMSEAQSIHLGNSGGFSWGDAVQIFIQAAYNWNKWFALVWIEPGMSELALAAVLDTLPRTFAFRTTSVSEKLEPLKTKNGLLVLAQESLDQSLPGDLIVIPATHKLAKLMGETDPKKSPFAWAASQKNRIKDFKYNEKTAETAQELLLWIAAEPGLAAPLGSILPLTSKLLSLPRPTSQIQNHLYFWFYLRPLLLALLGFLIGNILTRGLGISLKATNMKKSS